VCRCRRMGRLGGSPAAEERKAIHSASDKGHYRCCGYRNHTAPQGPYLYVDALLVIRCHVERYDIPVRTRRHLYVTIHVADVLATEHTLHVHILSRHPQVFA